ncbi:MAG: hypothetical protein H0W09_04530 [Solirubrobacterales bacterium]|nr:hypothetical protein [Solirubrobacterales bacterium]
MKDAEGRLDLDFALRAGAGLVVLCGCAAALVAVALALGVAERDQPAVEATRVALAANEIARERAPRGQAPSPANRDAAGRSDRNPVDWEPADEGRLSARAARAYSHVIYQKSPGGVVASARRTGRWRQEIEVAARNRDIDPKTLEAVIFLESAGRVDAMAGPTPEAASGLGQIIPSTATDVLGLGLDLARSIELTAAIAKAQSEGKRGLVRDLEAERAQVDERFDPRKAIEGSALYLREAIDFFGREDLAIASYHMGIGNLDGVLRSYAGVGGGGSTADLVASERLSYARVYFDSGLDSHAETWSTLSSFGDESSAYLWKIIASKQILERAREDPDGLARTAELARAKATMEEVFHPEEETQVFDDDGELKAAIDGGELLPLPASPRLGWIVDRQMGELAPQLDVERRLYRALRPEALATLSYLAGRVSELSGSERPLRITSTVRDLPYQELLQGTNPEATLEYSLHTTGWSFDVLRDYEDDRQAEAFQFTLDRMRAAGLLDYAVESAAIHVTVSEQGGELLGN